MSEFHVKATASGSKAEDELEVQSPPETTPAPEPESPAKAAPETAAPPPEDEPIDVLKRKFEALKAQHSETERRAREAEARAEEIRRQSGTAELTHSKTVLEHAYALEETKLAQAKRQYAEQLRAGQYDEAADTQIEIARATGEMGKYRDAYGEIERRAAAPAPAPKPAPADPFEAAVATMEPRTAAWVREHADDLRQPQRQKIALAADQLASAYGHQPGTPEYLEFMNAELGYTKAPPQPQEPATPVPAAAPAPQPRRRMAAAPPSRMSSNSGTQTVHLTEDDMRQARNLKMSVEEYGKYKLKSQQQQSDSISPFHFRVTAS